MVEILREHVACSHSRIMESSITVVQIWTATSCGVLLREIMTPTKNGVTAKVSLLLTFIANIISEAKNVQAGFRGIYFFLTQLVKIRPQSREVMLHHWLIRICGLYLKDSDHKLAKFVPALLSLHKS